MTCPRFWSFPPGVTSTKLRQRWAGEWDRWPTLKGYMPERKIIVYMKPSDNPDDAHVPYQWVILEWSDHPVWRGEYVLPGTEHGSWFNTGLCNWAATPEAAFAAAYEAYKKFLP
jgi:hypothetical protein